MLIVPLLYMREEGFSCWAYCVLTECRLAVTCLFIVVILQFFGCFFFFSFEHQYCLHLNLQHDHFNGRNVHKASVKLQERLGWTVFDKCIESPKRQKKKRRKTVLSPLVAVHHATLFYLLFQSEHFEIRSDVRNFYFENVMF